MEDTNMARVNKDTTIGEVIQIDAGVIPILMGAGMHCVGCPSSAGETLEEAAMVHGIDGDMLVEEIQSYLDSLS
jgi:hybrid cluster-associated redox disulfide protein